MIEIIAEAAQGYEGYVRQGCLLARAAARAGADAVKFQIIFADDLCTRDYRHRTLFEQLEMTRSDWQMIADEIHDAGLKFYADVSGPQSIGMARDVGVDGIKIHTTDFYNDPLIGSVRRSFSRLLISTGGIGTQELIEWLGRHAMEPSSDICIMYGFQQEPTPIENNHLHRLPAMRAALPPGYQFGFMDHTDGECDDALDVALMALPLGISVIEKHITLDRLLALEDFQSALAPARFATFVQKVRRLLPALGSASLELSAAETAYRHKAMKRLVASTAIKAGEPLTHQNTALLRCESSDPPEVCLVREDEWLDRRLAAAAAAGQPIRRDMLA